MITDPIYPVLGDPIYPVEPDLRDALKGALAEADEALGGDSNDAEHDALYSIRQTLAEILGVTGDPPSPDWPDRGAAENAL